MLAIALIINDIVNIIDIHSLYSYNGVYVLSMCIPFILQYSNFHLSKKIRGC